MFISKCCLVIFDLIFLVGGFQHLYDDHLNEILLSLTGPYQSAPNITEIIFPPNSKDELCFWSSHAGDPSWLDSLQSNMAQTFPRIDSLHHHGLIFKSRTVQALKSRQSPFRPRHDTLVVFTTCNQKKMTLLALQHLKQTVGDADVIIIDDHSIDGTVPYLTKKGYFVISKSVANGLTYSWNAGYHIALNLGYSYVIFANNDVLVPRGAIAELTKDLFHDVLVVPLTTAKGAGHHPGQARFIMQRLFFFFFYKPRPFAVSTQSVFTP